MYSIDIFERNLIKNINKLKQISIIDGENFRFVPYSVKRDFIQNYSKISTIFFVSKSYLPQNYLKTNNYIFKMSLLDIESKKNKKYCFDDSFCIYIANLLQKNNINYKLFTNDKFNDYTDIKNQDNSIINFNQNKYIFDPKKKLNDIKIDLIKNHKENFY